MGISGEMHAFLTGESSRLILALTNPLFYTGIITKIINVQYRTLKGSIKYMKKFLYKDIALINFG